MKEKHCVKHNVYTDGCNDCVKEDLEWEWGLLKFMYIKELNENIKKLKDMGLPKKAIQLWLDQQYSGLFDEKEQK